jgi:hypothetical protein
VDATPNMKDAQATASVVRLQKILQEKLSNAGLSAMKVDACLTNNACIIQAFSEYY